MTTDQTPELVELQDRIARAIAAVEELGAAQATMIAAKLAAEARAKKWADLAYETWDLLTKARPPEAGVGGYASWLNARNDLRRRLLATLDDGETV